MKNVTLLNNTSPEELTEKILNGIKSQLDDLKENFIIKEPDEFLTRKETAKFLKVSLVTLHHWSKQGIITPYKLGCRTYFKRNDIIDQLLNSNRSDDQ